MKQLPLLTVILQIQLDGSIKLHIFSQSDDKRYFQ